MLFSFLNIGINGIIDVSLCKVFFYFLFFILRNEYEMMNGIGIILYSTI